MLLEILLKVILIAIECKIHLFADLNLLKLIYEFGFCMAIVVLIDFCTLSAIGSGD